MFVVKKTNLTQKKFSKPETNKKARGIKQEMKEIRNPHIPQSTGLNALWRTKGETESSNVTVTFPNTYQNIFSNIIICYKNWTSCMANSDLSCSSGFYCANISKWNMQFRTNSVKTLCSNSNIASKSWERWKIFSSRNKHYEVVHVLHQFHGIIVD